MDSLIALTSLLNQQETDGYKTISRQGEFSPAIKSLYTGISNGKIKSDNDAYKYLYEGQHKPMALNKLKTRFQKKLISSVFFIRPNQNIDSNYKKAKYELHKNWAASRILIDKGNFHIAIGILEKTNRLALKYDLTDLLVLTSRELQRYYYHINYNSRKQSYYTQQLYEKMELLKNELRLEEIYNILSQKRKYSKSLSNSDYLKILYSFEKEISFINANFESFLNKYHYFQIETTKLLLETKIDKCIEVSKHAINYFGQKSVNHKYALAHFRNTLIYSYLSNGDIEKCDEVIKLNLAIFEIGSYSWFRLLHSKFICAVYKSEFIEMTESVSLALSSNKLKKFTFYFQMFNLLNAYVYLNSESQTNNFRINKFLNNVPLFTQDKRGLNIAILIIHLLHLISKRKFDIALNRLDALKQYSYRYLRNDNSLRSNCFIKMLIKIPDANYHPVALKRKTRKLFEKLSATSYTYTDNPSEIEVIPYENLWEIVLQILENNRRKKRA